MTFVTTSPEKKLEVANDLIESVRRWSCTDTRCSSPLCAALRDKLAAWDAANAKPLLCIGCRKRPMLYYFEGGEPVAEKRGRCEVCCIFIEADKLRASMVDLLDAYEHVTNADNHSQDEIATKFPFAVSLDEQVAQVQEWVDNLRDLQRGFAVEGG